MNKILLVFEDYPDLMSTESHLKKVGFDVLGVTNEFSLSEQVLSFNPDAIIACGKGSKVSSLTVGKKLKDMTRWPGKVILLFAAMHKPAASDLIKIRADLVLETPLAPQRLIQVLAKLLGHDETVLLEKLNKIQSAELSSDKDIHVVGGSTTVTGNEIFRIHGEASDAESEKKSLFGRLKENHKELYSDAQKTSLAEDNQENIFPDVDLKEVEFEISGGKPEVTTNFTLNTSESAAEVVFSPLQEEVARVQKTSAERIAKYTEMTESIVLTPTSTVRRIDARLRQKDLEKDWDMDKLRNNDELRREFTKALFKK